MQIYNLKYFLNYKKTKHLKNTTYLQECNVHFVASNMFVNQIRTYNNIILQLAVFLVATTSLIFFYFCTFSFFFILLVHLYN